MRQINLHESRAGGRSVPEIGTNLSAPSSWLTVPAPLKEMEARHHERLLRLALSPADVPGLLRTKAVCIPYALFARPAQTHPHQSVRTGAARHRKPLLSHSHPDDFKGFASCPSPRWSSAPSRGSKRELEIRPGPSNQLKLMNRIAPEFILKQLSKPVDRMLAESNKPK